MTKAYEQRTKNSLDRTRVKLKAREIELIAAEKALDRERAEVRRERADTVAMAQLLCERHGLEASWDPEAPLPEILDRHLLGPLLAGRAAATVAAPPVAPPVVAPVAAPRTPVAAPEPPRTPVAPRVAATPAATRTAPPRRLQAVPPTVHRVLVVDAQDKAGLRGSSCRCICGWISAIVPTDAEAWRRAAEHEGRAVGRPASADAGPSAAYR